MDPALVKPLRKVIEKDSVALSRIVSYTEGLPLSLELAAARLGVVPARLLLQKMESSSEERGDYCLLH